MIIRKLNNYLKFINFFAFSGIFITFICSSLIAINFMGTIDSNLIKILSGAFSAGFLACASHALNDIFDTKIDKINKPFRSIVSKKLSFREAKIITIILYTISFSLALLVNLRLFLIILIMSVFTIIYSIPPIRTKRSLLLGNITIAIPRGLLIILAGWSAVLSISNILPWYIGCILMIYLIGSSATKDISDIKGDKKYGIETLPAKFGIKNTALIIAPFMILSILLIPFGIYLNILESKTLPLILLLAYSLYIIELIRKYPDKLSKINNNHVSWVHSYILFMILNIGFCIAYLL